MTRYSGHRLEDGRIISVANNDDIIDEGIEYFNKRQRKSFFVLLGVIIPLVLTIILVGNH